MSLLGVASAALAVGVAFVALPGLLRDFAGGLLEAQRGLANFSGNMAAVFAESDARRAMREMQMGDRLADSTRQLSRAYNQLADDTAELSIAFQALINWIGEKLANIGSGIVNFDLSNLTPLAIANWLSRNFGNGNEIHGSLRDIANGVNRILGIAERQDGTDMGTWLNETAQDARQKRQQNDWRFQRPRMPNW